uniref:Mos1 transposase HTH domain-containing protein n=1 Tax=Meloidogyne incognita TaxID=6306 RepID=A0A914NUN7_MELIC
MVSKKYAHIYKKSLEINNSTGLCGKRLHNELLRLYGIDAPCLSTMQRWFRHSTKKVKLEPPTQTPATLTTSAPITPSTDTLATERKLLRALADTMLELLEVNMSVTTRLAHLETWLGARKFLCIR